MQTVVYSSKQVEVLLGAANILIPVCTAYVLLAAGGLRQLQKKKLIASPGAKATVIFAFALAIAAVGFWSGTLAFMVDCAHVLGRTPGSVLTMSSNRLNSEWTLGLLCAQLALLSLFISISLYCRLAYKLLFVDG